MPAMIRLAKVRAATKAETAKAWPCKAFLPGGRPIGETGWLEDDWMDQLL